MTMELAGDRPPRYDKKRLSLIVGRGPVPRQRPRNPTLAGETRSDARVASEGPRTTGTSRPGGLSYGGASRPGGLSYGIASKYETPSVKF